MAKLQPCCHHMPPMQELLAINEVGQRDQAGLLKSYIAALLPVLLLDQQEEQLEALASIVGKV